MVTTVQIVRVIS